MSTTETSATSAAFSTSIQRSIAVNATVERAFSVFTEDMASWWPKEHHLLQVELRTMVFEPRVGGRVYDVGVDGSECHFATVLAYEPPVRVAFTWKINLQWQLEEDLDRVSEVEVRFVAETPDRTRVELEHRHLDRHGSGWETMQSAVGSPDGWEITLRNLRDRLEAS